MFINISHLTKPRNIYLFLKAIAFKLIHKDYISFSFFFNLSRHLDAEPGRLTVVDIGANKGQFALSVLLMHRLASVCSYEPQMNLEKYLANIAKRYPLRFNYKLKAVSDSTCTKDFYITPNNEQSSFQRPLFTDAKIEEVSSINANSIFVETSYPILLKIDTQGHDLRILRSIDRIVFHKVKYLLVEAAIYGSYEYQDYVEDIISFVRSIRQFKRFDILDQLYLKPDQLSISEQDLLFTFEK